MLDKVAVSLCVLFFTFTPCLGDPKNTTKYQTFAIAGTTALEIVKSLNGSLIALGHGAYGTTLAEVVSSGGMIRTANACKVPDLGYRFTIKLPTLRNSDGLKGKTMIAWSGFAAFIKAHEETHRRIWLDCAIGHANAVASLTGPTCGAVVVAARALYKKSYSACVKRQLAFDVSERKRVVRLPLMLMAKNKQ
jgi:predicted secreted Zn-dependent protease